MTTYSYDNKSLIRDGKRWFPMMGEIHYSRYPSAFWREALAKMKAGGVDIISSYVIWIHHEEVENEWDFTGCRNLRAFVKEIKRQGLTMILRIGPWVHAEVRNGGFPDWLLTKCPKARSNDEAYFSEVKKLYEKIFEQVKGLLVKDNGPIIGVQIENEFGHCGGLSGAEGEAHMKRLTQMAKDAGFDVPLYTATGWGGAVTAGLLPVMGGYCDAPWDPRTSEIEPSGNFVFTYERNDHAIGCDFGLGEGITFDMKKFPYLTAELGGGLQPTFKRRTVAMAKDIEAMSIAKMGSGCTLLGYYMYHGGTNPEGKLSTLEESKATGSLNDLLVKNYDFRAPLGEYGHANETYKRLRRLAMFLHDYGEELCEMDTYIPEENPLHPENFTDLRHSWRFNAKTGKGYLFVNNYQRHHKMENHPCAIVNIPEALSGIKKEGKCPQSGMAGVPSDFNAEDKVCVNAADGDSFFIAVNRGMPTRSDIVPLCKLAELDVYYYRETPADLCDRNDSNSVIGRQFPIETINGRKAIILTEKESLNAYKKTFDDMDALYITNSDESCDLVYSVVNENDQEKEEAEIHDESKTVYEYITRVLDLNKDSYLPPRYYTDITLPKPPQANISELYGEEKKAWKINVAPIPQEADDVVMKIYYLGSTARLYIDGVLVDDHLFMGKDIPWEVGLKRFGRGAKTFTLEIDPLSKDEDLYLEENKNELFYESGTNTICSLTKVGFDVYAVKLV